MLKEEMSAAYFRQDTKDKPVPLGAGTLTLSREGLKFTGAGGSREIPMEDFLFLVLDDVKAVMVNTQTGFYRFEFKNRRLMVKWFFCHRLMKAGENG
ncbi:MAG: hypothetical protein IK019_06710, partial [Clostridia bacterium]|nr:hypothetical protein [Clostridia bacterium]